jgi:hypothetical protein
LRCDSLWIDSDRSVAVVTWRGLTDVGREEDVGRLVVAADPQGKKLRWAAVEKRLEGTAAPTLRLNVHGLPPDEPDPGPPPDPLARRHDTVKGQRGPESAAPVVAMPASGYAPGPDIQDAPTNPLERTQQVSRAPASKRAAATAVSPKLAGLPAPPVAGPPSGAPESVKTSRPLMAMGAPLGRPVAPSPASVAGPRPPRPGAPTRTSGLTLRKDLTIQRYAEISAALAQKGVNRAAVLRAHLLTEPAWALVDQHWKKNIAAEAEQGESALSDAYDDAYVSHQERLRRPIDLAAYACLQVGVERGEVGRLLADLDLELADLVRLQRVWARRTAASPELGAELARAIDEARRTAS